MRSRWRARCRFVGPRKKQVRVVGRKRVGLRFALAGAGGGVPARWSRLVSVGAEAGSGQIRNSAASRGSIVQAPRPKTALMPLGTLAVPWFQIAFCSASSISAFYLKGYLPLSQWIVSGANTNGRRGQVSDFAPTIHQQLFWHADCGQLCNWPPTKGPTASCGTPSRSVGVRAQQILSPALPPNDSRGDSR